MTCPKTNITIPYESLGDHRVFSLVVVGQTKAAMVPIWILFGILIYSLLGYSIYSYVTFRQIANETTTEINSNLDQADKNNNDDKLGTIRTIGKFVQNPFTIFQLLSRGNVHTIILLSITCALVFIYSVLSGMVIHQKISIK